MSNNEIRTSVIRKIFGQYVVCVNDMVIAIENRRRDAETKLREAKRRPWGETVKAVEAIRLAQQAEREAQ